MATKNLFCTLFDIELNNEAITIDNKEILLNSLDEADHGLPIVLMAVQQVCYAKIGFMMSNCIYADFSFDEFSLFGIVVKFNDYKLLKTNEMNELIDLAKRYIATQQWLTKCKTIEDKILAIRTKCREFILDEYSQILSTEMDSTFPDFNKLNKYSEIVDTNLIASYFIEDSHQENTISLKMPQHIYSLKDKRLETSLTPEAIKTYIEELKVLGDDNVKELIKQMAFVGTVDFLNSSNENVKLMKSSGHNKINDILFLSALMGAPSVLSVFADYFDCPTSEIQFSDPIYRLRSRLEDSFEERTFEDGNNQSINWFQKIENLTPVPKVSEDVAKILVTLLGTGKSRYSFSIKGVANFIESGRELTPLVTEFIDLNTDYVEDSYFSSKRSLTDELNKVVVGQKNAKKSLLDSVTFYNTTCDLPIFTFLGKSGVGKTSLAETFAVAYAKHFQTGHKVYLINCENYSDDKDAMRLFGSGQQYVDSFLGELTSVVALYPRQTLIFDEIEKAHSSVHRSLLTLLNKRKIRDYTTGMWVDFSQCTFIFTTNLGAGSVDEINDSHHAFDVATLLREPQVKLSGFGKSRSYTNLPIEFINRLASGHIVPFSSLNEWDIARLFLNLTAQLNLKNNWEFNDFYSTKDYELVDLLLDTYSGDFSPRSIVTHGDKLLSQTHAYLNDECQTFQPISKLTKRGFAFKSHSFVVITDDKELRNDDSNTLTKNEYQLTWLSTKQLSRHGSLIETLGKYDLVVIDDQLSQIAGQNIDVLESDMRVLKPNSTVIPSVKLSVEKLDYYFKAYPVFNSLLKRGIRAQKSEYMFNAYNEDEQLICEISITSVKPTLTPDLINLPFVKLAKKTDIKLADVVGMQVAKDKLSTVLKRLTETNVPTKFSQSKGALLYGEPGTGKTFLVQALANEVDIPFISVNSSDITIGDSELNIDTLFKELKANAPCVVFFDEFDAIAQKRSELTPRQNILVNKLLTAINGFENDSKPIYIIAATNTPENIDPAIKRPGRIDELIHCLRPTEEELKQQIINLANEYKLNFSDPKLHSLIVSCRGLTIPAIEKAFSAVEQPCKDIEASYLSIQMNLLNFNHGELLIREFTNEESDKVKAYHEAGHLLAFKLLTPQIEICSCSIISTAKQGGWTSAYMPLSENTPVTASKLFLDLQISLAGKAAEEIMFGESSFGSKQDIKCATQMLKEAYQSGCLSDEEWLVDASQFTVEHSELIKKVSKCLSEQFKAIRSELSMHKSQLISVAEALRNKKILFHDDIETLLNNFSNKQKAVLH